MDDVWGTLYQEEDVNDIEGAATCPDDTVEKGHKEGNLDKKEEKKRGR